MQSSKGNGGKVLSRRLNRIQDLSRLRCFLCVGRQRDGVRLVENHCILSLEDSESCRTDDLIAGLSCCVLGRYVLIAQEAGSIPWQQTSKDASEDAGFRRVSILYGRILYDV